MRCLLFKLKRRGGEKCKNFVTGISSVHVMKVVRLFIRVYFMDLILVKRS